MKLTVLADDFTGSNDTGVQFSKKGLRTVVTTNLENLNKSVMAGDVLVIDTESRFDSSKVAYNKIYEVIKNIGTNQDTLLYKKIDSTFRGNIGAEIQATMDATGISSVLLIPALPSNGRTTENGFVYLNGKLLAETEIAKDPKNPVSKSEIRLILAEQTDAEVLVYKKTQDYTTESILKWLSKHHTSKQQIFVFDATTDADLELLAPTIAEWDKPFLLSGTAGLAAYLPEVFQLIDKKGTLSIIGSVSQVTREQVNYAQSKGLLHLVSLTAQQLLEKNYWEEIMVKVHDLLKTGQNVALYTASSRSNIEASKTYAHQNGIDVQQVSTYIALALGQLSSEIIKRSMNSIGGVFVTGGDTLINLAEALGIDGMVIQDEVQPAIPVANFLSPLLSHIPIVTKAGAFGKIDTLYDVLEFFNQPDKN